MRIANDNLDFDAVDMSGNLVSEAIWIGHALNYAIQLVFTGSPNGTFKLQASIDAGKPNEPQETERDDGIVNWTDIADSSQAISAAGDHLWTVQNAGYNWVRVVYTASSGSGTLTSARLNTKGI